MQHQLSPALANQQADQAEPPEYVKRLLRAQEDYLRSIDSVLGDLTDLINEERKGTGRAQIEKPGALAAYMKAHVAQQKTSQEKVDQRTVTKFVKKLAQ